MTCAVRASAAIVLLACWLLLSGCGWIYGLGSAFGCVAEGTSITTPAGPRPIQDIRTGDIVLSRAPSGLIESCHVTRAVSTISPETLQLTLGDGRKLRVTAAHPIATPVGWHTAGELAAGDTVQTDLDLAPVVSIEAIHQRIRVYDLTVAGNENFFANGVLVHNKSVIPPATLEQMAGEWEVLSDRSEAWVMGIELDKTGHGRAIGPGTWRREGERNVPDSPRLYSAVATIKEGRFQIALDAEPPDEAQLIVFGHAFGSYHGTQATRSAADVEVGYGPKGKYRDAAIMRRPGEIADSIKWVENAAANAADSAAEPQILDAKP